MHTAPRLRRAGWVAMTVLATLLALASTRYFSLDPRTFLPAQAAVYLAHLGPLLLHVTAVLAAATGGLLLAPLSLGGPLAHLRFGTLAVVVLATTAAGFTSILRGRVTAHRTWMMRSYALIVGAVTFRAWLALFGIAGLPFQQAYAVGAWSSRLIDLLAAEALIAGLPAARRRAGRQAAMPSSNAPAGES